MNRIVVLLGAGLVAVAAWAATPQLMDGVAAVVNTKVITVSDVHRYVLPVYDNLRRNLAGQELYEKFEAARRDALESLIDRALIIHEYHDKGYVMPANIVDTQIDEIIATDFGGDRTAFVKTLQARGLTLSQYRDQLRDDVIIQGMTNRKLHQQIVISPYKIDQYYQEHLADYRVEDQIKLRMIFIRQAPPTTNAVPAVADPAAPAAAAPAHSRRGLAEEILAKLDTGESFESLAKVYSDGREAKDGGNWGWIGRNVLLPELGDAAFALKPGQHSRLVETPDGYYILQLEDFKPAHTQPLDAVRADIEKILQQELRTQMRKDWLKQLRAKAYIRYY